MLYIEVAGKVINLTYGQRSVYIKEYGTHMCVPVYLWKKNSGEKERSQWVNQHNFTRSRVLLTFAPKSASCQESVRSRYETDNSCFRFFHNLDSRINGSCWPGLYTFESGLFLLLCFATLYKSYSLSRTSNIPMNIQIYAMKLHAQLNETHQLQTFFVKSQTICDNG